MWVNSSKFVFSCLNSSDDDEKEDDERTEAKASGSTSKRIPDAPRIFPSSRCFFPVLFAYLAKIPRAANTIVAGGGYISSVKRKACSKLNFPRRGRLPGVDATAERDPMHPGAADAALQSVVWQSSCGRIDVLPRTSRI